MSAEAWALIISGASLLVGIGALYFAWRASKSGEQSVELTEQSIEVSQRSLNTSEEQLRIARQVAAMQPALEVSFRVKRSDHDPESGTLQVDVLNTGRVAAHNVHGWIHLHGNFFGPPKPPPEPGPWVVRAPIRESRWGVLFRHDAEPDENGLYEAQIYDKEELIPTSYRTFGIPVTLRQVGKVPLTCHVVCNLGASFQGTPTVEVPEGS